VLTAVFSPDGSRVATASYDKTARIRDVATAKEIAVLGGHHDRVEPIASSPDGNRIVAASDDKTAKIWNVHAPTMATTSLKAIVDNRLRTKVFKHLLGIRTALGIIGAFLGLLGGLLHSKSPKCPGSSYESASATTWRIRSILGFCRGDRPRDGAHAPRKMADFASLQGNGCARKSVRPELFRLGA
jgi:hypothetical protein